MDVYQRVNEIMGEKLKNYELADADVVILPEVGDTHWSSFSEAMNLIDEGEEAAREKLDEIRQVLPGFKNWLRLKSISKLHKKRG
jgi:predicted acylesterase/phospholipase RssA